MRPIDAVALTEGIELHRQSTDQKYELDRQWAVGYNAGLDRALYSIAYAKTIAPPPNDPLTLEELREMDGEPVWVERPGYGKNWALVNVWAKSTNIIYLTCNNGMVLHPQPELDSGAKIYRRKPEEGMP